jgi:hypothetical protein
MGTKANWIFLSLFFVFPVSVVLANEMACTKGGGQYLNDECYCVRTRSVPPIQSEEKYLSQGHDCPGLWGIELTFTNAFLQKENVAQNRDSAGPISAGPKAAKAAGEWVTAMGKTCQKRTRSLLPDKCVVAQSKVSYDDGYYYIVSTDPGVVEVQGRPLSLKEWRDHEDRLDKDIFKVARDASSIVPHRSAGSGHLHMDIASHFRGNFRLLVDFLIDFQNHPYLALCALGETFITNPPLAIQSQSQIDKFDDVIKGWSKLSETVVKMDRIEARLLFLNKEAFKDTYADLDDSGKFQAISLNHVNDFGSIEIRALRPEENARHVRLLMQLFEQRLKYLRHHPGQLYKKIKLAIPQIAKRDILQSEPAVRKFYHEQKDFKQLCVDEYYSYVSESGLAWSDYKPLLYPEMQDVVPSKLKP